MITRLFLAVLQPFKLALELVRAALLSLLRTAAGCGIVKHEGQHRDADEYRHAYRLLHEHRHVPKRRDARLVDADDVLRRDGCDVLGVVRVALRDEAEGTVLRRLDATDMVIAPLVEYL